MSQKANEAINWKTILIYTLAIALVYAVFQGGRHMFAAHSGLNSALSVSLLSFVSCFAPICILGMVFLYVFNRMGDFDTTDT